MEEIVEVVARITGEPTGHRIGQSKAAQRAGTVEPALAVVGRAGALLRTKASAGMEVVATCGVGSITVESGRRICRVKNDVAVIAGIATSVVIIEMA